MSPISERAGEDGRPCAGPPGLPQPQRLGPGHHVPARRPGGWEQLISGYSADAHSPSGYFFVVQSSVQLRTKLFVGLCQKTQPVELWLLHVARPGEQHGEQDLGEADGVARPQVPLPLLLLCPQVLQCQGQVRGRGQVGRGSVVIGLVETAMVMSLLV